MAVDTEIFIRPEEVWDAVMIDRYDHLVGKQGVYSVKAIHCSSSSCDYVFFTVFFRSEEIVRVPAWNRDECTATAKDLASIYIEYDEDGEEYDFPPDYDDGSAREIEILERQRELRLAVIDLVKVFTGDRLQLGEFGDIDDVINDIAEGLTQFGFNVYRPMEIDGQYVEYPYNRQ